MKVKQLDKDKQAYGRKLFLIEGTLASIAMRSFIGSILTAFALALGANEGQIGFLTSARRLAGFAQLLTNHLLERIGGKRRLYYCAYVLPAQFGYSSLSSLPFP